MSFLFRNNFFKENYMPAWLEGAVFYEIYPQSFYDASGDGVGDIEGIRRKLDYVRGLGCNALWINPCFDSPFKDAGYDVRDYTKIAARYGTNEDMYRLFAEAHQKGMRVLLDLVPGHTSEEHPWFQESKRPEPNAYSNRYIWTNNWFFWGQPNLRFVAGEAERNGVYLINFFKCQPALNYGFGTVQEPWQLPVDHPDCVATREALKGVMRFWLEKGCDGFRVDMADSLVKNDDEHKNGTQAIWRNVRSMLDAEFPEAALVSEWSSPGRSLRAGFHADFLLDHEGSGYKSLLRDYRMDAECRPSGEDNSFFKKDGHGDIRRFLDQYLPWYEDTKNIGFMSLITGNHDTPRVSTNFSHQELALVYCVLFTFPGVPFLYYGDEIGMRYMPLGSKEGGYTRTGSRTPMQWGNGPNKGFSPADEAALYLPVDPNAEAPTVEAQERDPGSLLNTVKTILKLRHAEPDLQAAPNFSVVYAERGRLPFVYRRGSLILAVNPGTAAASAEIRLQGKAVYTRGTCALENGVCHMEGQSFGIWRE
jgi:maltose alpha-D-glucosyltransferase/alpha-amylase